jgi:hypothetical protein
MTVKGSLKATNRALRLLEYHPMLNWYGAVKITVEVNDLGYSGSGGPQLTRRMLYVQVHPRNDPPRIVYPATYGNTTVWHERGEDRDGERVATVGLEVLEDTLLRVVGLRIEDVDIGSSGLLTTAVSAKHGTTTMTAPGGTTITTNTTITTITTTNTTITTNTTAAPGTFTYVGNGRDTNVVLSTLVYVPSPHWHGLDTLNITTTDDQKATATALLLLRVVPVNDAPAITLPGLDVSSSSFTLAMDEDTTVRPFRTITIADPDSDDQPRGALTESPLRATVTSYNGTLALPVGHRGLVWLSSSLSSLSSSMHVNMSSTGARTLEFRASATALTEAVASLTFRPDPDFFGVARIALGIDDQGRSGRWVVVVVVVVLLLVVLLLVVLLLVVLLLVMLVVMLKMLNTVEYC